MTKPRYGKVLQAFAAWQVNAVDLPSTKLSSKAFGLTVYSKHATIIQSGNEFDVRINESGGSTYKDVVLTYTDMIKLVRFFNKYFMDDDTVVIEPVVKYVTKPCQCWWCNLLHKLRVGGKTRV